MLKVKLAPNEDAVFGGLLALDSLSLHKSLDLAKFLFRAIIK